MEALSKYLKENKITLLSLSKATGIKYFILYDSLENKNRKRELRVSELFKICDYLKLSVDELRK